VEFFFFTIAFLGWVLGLVDFLEVVFFFILFGELGLRKLSSKKLETISRSSQAYLLPLTCR